MSRLKENKFLWINRIVSGLLVLLIVWLFSIQWEAVNDYKAYNTSSLSYVRATVVEITGMNLEKDTLDDSRYLGTQSVVVEIKEGDYAGQKIALTNNLSRTQNVKVREGQRVIVCVDAPENTAPFFTIFNYDRSVSLGIILLIFTAGVLAVGGQKGLRALVGLIVTIAIILLFYVQGIFHGKSVVVIAVITMLLVTAANLYILNGISIKTMLASLSTLCGLLAAGVFCMLCQKILCITGYNLEDAEALLLIRQSTGLEVKHLLVAGVLIAALGAVMDVAVSIVAALYEIVETKPQIGAGELFRAGMNIGRDMIGTMCNTLILAFVGSSLTTILLLMGYGYQTSQLLNSDFLAIELIQGIASTFAVVLTVPVTSIISTYFLRGVERNEKI